MSELKDPYNPGRGNDRLRAEAAEKTVAVLKNKVHQMYSDGALNLIQKQLDQQKRRQEMNELRTAELKRYSEHLEQEVAERTKAIKTILDNVTFGFLIVDRELSVQDGFTKSCHALFGQTVTPKSDLTTLLRLKKGSKDHTQMVLGVDQVFEDLIDEEVTLAQVPSRFRVNDRTLQAEGRVVRGEDQKVVGLLLTISDISMLEAAQKESRHHEVLVRILRQKNAFQQFLIDMKHAMTAARAQIEDQVFVRRAVHTVKGNAASYWLDDVARVAHEAENKGAITVQGIDAIDQEMRSFLEVNKSILEIEYDNEGKQSFEIGAEQLERLRAMLSGDNVPTELRAWASEVVLKPARDLFGPVHTFVERLSERLSKNVRFSLSGDDHLVDAEVMRPVLSTLSHLLRNAVDHGIEPAHGRGGKHPVGQVKVNLVLQDDAYLLTVSDDGGGVDVDRLTQRAVELKMISPQAVEKMSRQDKINLMFQDGLSVNTVANDISGRGVGMSAVQAAAVQAGGHVVVETQAKVGTQVTVRIPRSV